MNIIFLAPPAAGKGTQSMLICDKYNLSHISTGDLLREEIKSGNEFGNQIKEIIESGNLVNDDIILELLNKKLSSVNGYILDGFPRNINQAIKYDELLDSLNQNLDYVIYLDLDKEIAKKRILGRISCPSCGNVYNNLIEENKPLAENLCNDCNTELIKRADDNEVTFDKRYDTYLKETAPLIEYYQKKGKLYKIDSSLSKNEIFEKICEIIND